MNEKVLRVLEYNKIIDMLIDCATLSPITTDHRLIPKSLSDDTFIITLKCFDDYPDNLEDHIIEAFAEEHIILE